MPPHKKPDAKSCVNATTTVIKVLDKHSRHSVLSKLPKNELVEHIEQLERRVEELNRGKEILNGFLSRVGFDGDRLIDLIVEEDEGTVHTLRLLQAFRLDINQQHPALPVADDSRESALALLESLQITPWEYRDNDSE